MRTLSDTALITLSEVIALARQAGFGCDCTPQPGNTCPYELRVGTRADRLVVLLPQGNTEALERLEQLLQWEYHGATDTHYWCIDVATAARHGAA